MGVDLWRSVDQSGNDPARTLANAAAEGVTVELITADLRTLPIATGSVDVVLSSLAIHNIPDDAGRTAAIAEAARILRPGGRLLIVDFRHAPAYGKQLIGLGLTDVAVRDLGPRFWYGGPWGRASAVTATGPR
ncbi:class I SAM-dependent methyltransferase [Paractinoplanes lichenicola]|uniref:Class I SAM-dependent methyltransferase n=1 Tax=Paractinoplanes lichenicola TaxID=2802976 RepID=A0ABS1W3L2_9ACTN|nr:class I SAM-dependent methyltransferase [Actinoplanes lichenicola]